MLTIHDVVMSIKKVTKSKDCSGWFVSVTPASPGMLETVTIEHNNRSAVVVLKFEFTEEECKKMVEQSIRELHQPVNPSVITIPIARYNELIDKEQVYNQLMKLKFELEKVFGKLD